MFDPDLTHESLEKIKNNLQACRDWLHKTFEQPYTIEEMTETLAYYLNTHLYYYSNLPGQVAEKQQRIFKIQDRLIADHSNRTRDLRIALATSSDKRSLLRGEIARYDHPYLYYKQGQYYNNGFPMVIPHVIDMLAEDHSPYFEFVFDDNLELKNRDLYDFFSDLYFLEFLRQELITLENQREYETSLDVVKNVGVQYGSFVEVFRDEADFRKVVDYLKSIYVFDDEGKFIEASGRKKHLAVLMEVLRKKSKVRPIYDKDAASLMRKEFGIASFSSTYMGKYFSGREELIEEIMKDLSL